MAKPLSFKYSVLNIKTHPHSPEKYCRLFQATYENRITAKIWGDSAGIIGSLNTSNKENYLTGEVFKFSKIDQSTPWYNWLKATEATEEETKGINIPSYLSPNLYKFLFTFFPRNHRLVIETYWKGKQLSPKLAHLFFKRIFNDPSLPKEFGEVDIIIQPHTDTIESILNEYSLRNLELLITKPNPESLGDSRDRFQAKLDAWNTRRYEQKFTSHKGQFISFDEELETTTRIASTDGHVKASGLDRDGRAIMVSTLSKPLEKTIIIPKKKSHEEYFLNTSEEIVAELLKLP